MATDNSNPFSVNPSHCPLCGQANRCAMELEKESGQPQGPCWCTQVNFTTELLARIPVAAKDKACICAACAQALAHDKRP